MDLYGRQFLVYNDLEAGSNERDNVDAVKTLGLVVSHRVAQLRATHAKQLFGSKS